MSETAQSPQERLEDITSLLRTVSSLDDPQQVQVEFSKRLRDLTYVQAYVAASRRNLPTGEYKITRSTLDSDDVSYETHNPWERWAMLPTRRGGFIGEVIEAGEPIMRGDLRVTDDPALGDAIAGMRSVIACPLFDEGEALNWAFMFREAPDAFTDEELETFLLRGNLIGRMTKNLIVQREVKELNRRLTAQLDEIASIQRSLLPDRLPSVPRLGLAASYLTSNEAGGDYYDVLPLPNGRYGLCVADVSGHGAGAATVVAVMHALLRSRDAAGFSGPAEVLTYLNDQLSASWIGSNFVTAFFAEWEPRENRLIFTNAGHHAPTLRRAGGEIVPLEGAHDVPLGVVDGVRYEQQDIELEPDDTVVMFTDGIVEAFSPPPERELFGNDRLFDALRGCSGEPACVIESIHERLYDHTRSRTREDDQTILAARVRDE